MESPLRRPIFINYKRRVFFQLLSVVAGILRVLRIFTIGSKKTNEAIIIEPYGMGDVIALRPLISELNKNAWGVSLITKPHWIPLFENSELLKLSGIDIPWSSYESSQKYSFSKLLSLFREGGFKHLWKIGNGRFGIDPRGDIRSVILLYLFGCHTVFCAQNYVGSNAEVPIWAAKRIYIPLEERSWKGALRFLNALSIPPPHHLTPPKIECLNSSKKLNRTIAILPVAPWPGRLWERDNWINLIRELAQRNWNIVILCGPKQTNIVDDIPMVAIEEMENIGDWIRWLSQTTIVITLDSGPMHLADALGIPLLALFGPGQLPKWAPSGRYSRVIHHQNCPEFSPCHQVEENISFGVKMMSMITVSEVLSEFERLVYDANLG